MTTAWTNTEIEVTYGDGIQLGNSGGGITTVVQNVRDALGNVTALWLSTTTVMAIGTVGFLVPNNAGYSGVPGGYRILRADGVTAQTLISMNAANNIDISPEGLSSFVAVNADVLVRRTKGYWSESNDISQDLLLLYCDTSNNLFIGVNDSFTGSSQLGDTSFRVQTGKAFHWLINTTEVMAIGSGGEISLGKTAPATSATTGFPYIPVMAGTPIGTPTTKAGYVPIVADSSGNKIWIFVGGAWKGVAVAP